MFALPGAFAGVLFAFAYCVFSAPDYLLLWIRGQVIGQPSKKHSKCETECAERQSEEPFGLQMLLAPSPFLENDDC